MKLDYKPYIQELANAIEEVDWSNADIYAAYTAQIYYFVRHSTRLLALGAARMSFEDEPAHQRFLKHSREEANHEILAIRDCKAMGYDVFDFPELPALKAFYQTQYYNIEHVSPWAFMGYVFALEGMAIDKGTWLHEHITKIHGPGKSSFLKVHGNEDEEHVEEAVKLIESLSDKDIKMIQESLEMSVYLHVQMLRDLKTAVAKCKKPRSRAA